MNNSKRQFQSNNGFDLSNLSFIEFELLLEKFDVKNLQS